jgi:Domain of unknown function (DUF4351)
VNEYDVALKLLLQGSGGLAMQQIAGVAIEQWLNVEFPEVQSTRVDLLGEAAGGALVHIELQSNNHPMMALRMAEYCLRVYRVFARLPRQVVLYVGEDPLRMESELSSPDFSFRFRILDIRDLDGERLLESDRVGDNVIAVLARLRDQREAVQRIIGRIAGLEAAEREAALKALLILSGLRHLGMVVEQEARKMPILNNILDHEVLGREFKKGRQEGRQEADLTALRRIIEKRFGAIPSWAEERLATKSAPELEDLIVRVFDVQTLEELLK